MRTNRVRSLFSRKWLVLLLVFLLVISLLWFGYGRRFVRYEFAQLNLYYSVYFAAQVYAMNNDDIFPPLSPEPGRLMYIPEAVSREYFTDLRAWSYPGEADLAEPSEFETEELFNEYARREIDDQAFFYVGYAITNDTEASAFAQQYKAIIEAGGDFSDDLIVPEGQGNFGGTVLYRLRKDLAEHLVETADIDANTAESFELNCVYFLERPKDRKPSGGAVMYGTGYGEFVPYPGKFPMTENFITLLEELDNYER